MGEVAWLRGGKKKIALKCKKGGRGRGEGEEKPKQGRYPVGPTNIAYFASFKPFSE